MKIEINEKAQAKLDAIYTEKWTKLVSVIGQYAQRNLSRPQILDMNAFDGSYWKAAVRLMVVGQQTAGWGSKVPWEGQPDECVNHLKQGYGEFELGKKDESGKSWLHTPFWRAAHELYRCLNPDGPNNGFIWSNLNKLDEGGDRLRGDIADEVCSSFDCLPDEIRLARPHVVVFLTGPDYDDRLKNTFANLSFTELPSWPVRELAAVSAPNLPLHCYRTYHPGYLIRRGKLGILETIADIARRSCLCKGDAIQG